MTDVVPPGERICERCGRHDEWDDTRGAWTVVAEDGERQSGDPFCLHEWDINGNYSPIAE
ncbi:HEWD family protein [Halomicrobium salinisoli]|uniref:HEWD family protein n=1 Tax=Halomicrobium salinisoli TaxID=2878391 RepID=UPI001CF02C54|nr:HEWD family protein [Halomicrobium salinisoli]